MSVTFQDVKYNIKRVKDNISKAKLRSPYKQEVKLMAVTKTFSSETAQFAVDAGLVNIGENKVQEAQTKFPLMHGSFLKHMIGHLQSNKVNHALDIFDVIHSVDSHKILEKINRRAKKIDKIQNVLLQVKTSDEESKYGIPVLKMLDFCENIACLENVNIIGLMTIPKFSDSKEEIRTSFTALRNLLSTINEREFFDNTLTELSMGMSHDYEIAVEEGATIVRIGSAIFGKRN